MTEGKIFESFGAPDSLRVAHYSEGLYPVVPGVPVTLSGIVGKDIKTGKLVEGGTGPETKCILGEVERQLAAIRLSLRHVMHVRVMLAAHIMGYSGTSELSGDFKDMNKEYFAAFKDNNPPPTRDTIGGCLLLDDAQVEMVVTAWKPTSAERED